MESRPFKIRLAKGKDSKELLDLVERAASKLCVKLGDEDQQARWVAQQKEIFAERLEDPRSDVLLAVSDYGLVGCVYVQQGGDHAESHGCDAYLGGLYSAVRGMGIGMALNREALLCAAGRGAGSVYARLPKANRAAVRALGDLGFKRGGEEQSKILPQSVWVGLQMQLLHGALEPGPARSSRDYDPPSA